MCETEYYNKTYPSGERALVEQIKPCRHRCYESPSWSLKERVPTPYYANHTLPPTDSKERRRERRYSDHGRHYTDTKDYSPRRRNSIQTSQPIDIPARKLHRSSTTYDDNSRYYHEPRHESSRRRSDKPIIVERDSRDRGHRSSSRRESAAVPLGWEALYYGSPSRHDDKYKSRDAYLEPGRTSSHRRHSSSPMEINRSDGDRHRSSRRSRHEKPVVTSADGPLVPPYTSADILYGDSPIGSYGSSYHSHSRTSTPIQSPPKSPALKGVHWEDDVRAAQNKRISSRPRLKRSATISGAGTGKHLDGEVKGILKNTDNSHYDPTSGPAPAVQPLGGQDVDGQMYQSMEGLGIDDRGTSGKRDRAAAEYFESMDGMGDRLRSRITPRTTSSARRTPDVFSFLESSTPRGAWGEKATSSGSSRRRTGGVGERFYTDYAASPDYIY